MDYQGPIEAALTTDLRGEPFNFALWDTYTSAQLVVFKNAKKAPLQRCLAIIDDEHFLTAEDNVIYIWSIYNKKCQDQKLFLPARPNCLFVSRCTNYLFVGLSETLTIWALRSGNLLSSAQRHYQPISIIRATNDGSLIVSAGEDGYLLVWCFADLVNKTSNLSSMKKDSLENAAGMFGGLNEPKYSWHNHDAQITDMNITDRFCFTASTDASVNMYNLYSGHRLHYFTMPCELWSIAVDKNETQVFIGGDDGNIYQIVMSEIGLFPYINSSQMEDHKPIFSGHKGKVNLLKVSLDGSRLISGSSDSTCKIWNINQKKLLQDVRHQAPLANMELLFVPDGLAIKSMSALKAPFIVRQLKRTEQKLNNKLVTKDEVFDNSIFLKHSENDHPMLKYLSSNKHDETEKSSELPSSSLSIPKRDDITKEKLNNLIKLAAEKIFNDGSADILRQFQIIRGEKAVNGTGKRKNLAINDTDSPKKIKSLNNTNKN